METKTENKHEKIASEPKEEPTFRCIICGSKIWRNNYLRHTKTRKHRDALYVMQDIFEVK